MKRPRFEVAVLGGGPAGSTFASKLASLDVAVCLFDRPPRVRQHAGETLPASVAGLLRQLDVEIPGSEVAAHRPPRHVVVWGGDEPQVMPTEPPPGLEPSLYVWRDPFDRFLLDEARRRGIEVMAPAVVRSLERRDGLWRMDYRRAGRDGVLDVPFVADASGRSGLLGRRDRRRETGFRTVALTGHWQARRREEEDATLVETFPGGWAWSAPVGGGVRDVTLMMDRETGVDRVGAYHAALEQTSLMRKLLAGASLVDRIRGIDATPYRAERWAGEDFILLGDAASFLDPLAAHGVHKAIDSALLGAVVVRTILRRPELAEDAIEFYGRRLASIHDITRERLGSIYRQERRWPEAPFWRRRQAMMAPSPPSMHRAPRLHAGMRLQAGPGIHLREAGVLEGDWIARRSVLESRTERVRHLREVCLPDLFVSACAGAPVEEVARRAPVGFAAAMQALEWLVQAGYLEVGAEPVRGSDPNLRDR